MKTTILLSLLLLGGCVSIKEANRYGEVMYLTGKLEGRVQGAEPWKISYRQCSQELNVFKYSAERAAIKTDEKFDFKKMLDDLVKEVESLRTDEEFLRKGREDVEEMKRLRKK